MLELVENVLLVIMGFILGVWLDITATKKVSKKPVEIIEFSEDGLLGKCPCCGSDCNDVMNYCDQCGQSLDWRNEE